MGLNGMLTHVNVMGNVRGGGCDGLTVEKRTTYGAMCIRDGRSVVGSEHSNMNVTYCLLIEGHMYMMRLPLTKGVTGAGRENIVGLMLMTILEGPAVGQSIDTDHHAAGMGRGAEWSR